MTETNSNLFLPFIYENRSKVLNNQCNHSRISEFDKKNHGSVRSIYEYPWLSTSLFSLESHSLIYCAIPKIASRTLLSLIIYVHVRNTIDYYNTKGTNIVIDKIRAEQHINIRKLFDELRKNGIPLPNETEFVSTGSLIQIYLHLLRFSSVNRTSPSIYLNPYRLNLEEIFPNFRFKSITNVSNIFSPSFTRVLFVRHPFERLASAYKERIATLGKDRAQPEPYYDDVRKLICFKYTNFNSTQRPPSESHPCENFIPPFQHFVQYILMGTATPAQISLMDAHWQPYTMLCQVCKYKYNFIGKYETFNVDFISLLKRLNVSDWNSEKQRGASGQNVQYYQQLYSSLPNDMICKLKNLYHDDLYLFNYRIEDYINRPSLIC